MNVEPQLAENKRSRQHVPPHKNDREETNIITNHQASGSDVLFAYIV